MFNNIHDFHQSILSMPIEEFNKKYNGLLSPSNPWFNEWIITYAEYHFNKLFDRAPQWMHANFLQGIANVFEKNPYQFKKNLHFFERYFHMPHVCVFLAESTRFCVMFKKIYGEIENLPQTLRCDPFIVLSFSENCQLSNHWPYSITNNTSVDYLKIMHPIWYRYIDQNSDDLYRHIHDNLPEIQRLFPPESYEKLHELLFLAHITGSDIRDYVTFSKNTIEEMTLVF